MDDSGWKLIRIDEQRFLVRRCFSVDKFEVQLSDHRRLWSAEGTASDLLDMSQKENPLCEFDVSKVTKNIFNVFDNSLDSLRVDGNDVKFKTLKMSSNLGNTPFNLVWHLTDQGPDILYEEITYPLLYLVGKMGHCQNYLCKEVVQKDLVINEYLQEFGPLKWGPKTEKFNLDEFNKLFQSNDKSNPIEDVWEKHDVLHLLNKNVLCSKISDKEDINGESSKENNVTIKEEETIPESDFVVQPKLEITQVKEEKLDVPPIHTTTRSKRKKVKLNL